MDVPMVGARLKDRYRLDEVLGEGGMGVVFRSHDDVLDRDVAIKVLSNLGLGSEGRARLLREAQAVARLNHPNIVSVYDAGEENGLAFVVMELLKGHSLYEKKPETSAEIMTTARQICQALEHAHSHGVIYRDLKPENVIILPDGVVKLTDFGLAQSVSSRISSGGIIIGTVFYISPEATMGQPVDGRADLYALGVMMYEWLTGRLPYTGNDPLAVISQHLYSPVVPPRTLCADIPPAMDALIVSLLAKQPQDRPASALAVDVLLSELAIKDRPIQSGDQTNALGQIVRGRMVGREHELADLMGVWKRAMAGEGQVLLVSGEPGIGKTRLVKELMAHAAITGGKVHFGECYAEGGRPYAPFAQMLADELGRPGQPGLELPGSVLADIITIAPELRNLYNGGSQNLPGDPIEEQQHLIESMASWVTDQAGRSTVLVFIDDAHWADSGTLLVVRHLARRSRRQRLLIVLTYREIELSENRPLQTLLYDFNRERLVTRLKLTRLGREDTQEMLASMLSPTAEIDDALVDAVFRETEGNPFFIEEVCKALVEEGKLCCEDACWQATDLDNIGIPQSIRLTIQARLSRLPLQTQEIMKLAAILGREFDFDTLKQASGLDEDELITAIEEAERAQIVNEVPHNKPGGATFRFAHALIPSSLRESIIGLRRQRLHRRAALAIEELHPEDFENLAYQFEQAGDGERAIANYSRAIERALSIFANQEAEKYCKAALELIEIRPERAPLLAFLGEALFRQSRYEQAVSTWKEAIEINKAVRNFDQMARLYARSARATWYIGDANRALVTCQEGLAEIPKELETPGMAALLHEIARAYRFTDQPEEALPLCQQALALADKFGLAEIQAETLATIGILPNISYEAAEQALTRAIEIAEASQLPLTVARAHLNLSGHLGTRGNMVTALKHIERARDLAHETRIYTWEWDYLLSVIDVAITMADFTKAEENIRALRNLQGYLPNPASATVAALMFEAAIVWRRGDPRKAVAMLKECLAEALKSGEKEVLIYIYEGLAEILFEIGNLDAAEEYISAGLKAIQAKNGAQSMMLVCMQSMIRIRQLKLDEARALLEEARKLESQKHHPFQQAIFLWIEAQIAVAEQRLTEAWSFYEKAVSQARAIEYLWLEGYLLLEWAKALLKAQPVERAQARDLFDEARKVFTRAKSPGYTAQVETILRAIAN